MTMQEIPAKHLLMKNKDGSWFQTEYTVNLYRGCCHGCIYCDSRSSCYKIDHFDEVRCKKDALRILRDDLASKKRKGVISMGSMSDSYNPYEREMKLTRHALELIHAYGFGVSIATKSSLILRDIDLLKDISQHSPVIIKITITTPDDNIARIVEPKVCPSSERLNAVKKLREAGIYAGILLMPCLPWIEDDTESVLQLVDMAQEADARFIYPAFGMTLREGNREYYYENLDRYFPDLREKYQKRYRNKYVCTSPNAAKLYESFSRACDENGILYEMNRIIRAYRYGYGIRQFQLDLD